MNSIKKQPGKLVKFVAFKDSCIQILVSFLRFLVIFMESIWKAVDL